MDHWCHVSGEVGGIDDQGAEWVLSAVADWGKDKAPKICRDFWSYFVQRCAHLNPPRSFYLK